MGNRGKDATQTIMDGLLRFVAMGGFLTTALVIPNSAKIFEKPLNEIMGTLDKRAQAREIRRIMYYMKENGLINYTAKDYENGIQLTRAGKARLKQRAYETLQIPRPHEWDKKWRLVFFDIPEGMRDRRVVLTQKLRLMDFQKLQQSIWIHPFHCLPEIEAICETIDVRKYVSYVEISEIDGSQDLKIRFKRLLS